MSPGGSYMLIIIAPVWSEVGLPFLLKNNLMEEGIEMKKFWIVLCSLLSVVALSGCGPSAKEYMQQSLAIWNPSLEKISPWLNNKKMNIIMNKLEGSKDLSDEKAELVTFRADINKALSDMQALSVPKGESEAVQENIVAYYNKMLGLTDTLDKLVSLPKGFDPDDGNALIGEYNNQIEELNKNMYAVITAQQELAKSIGADFRVYQQH